VRLDHLLSKEHWSRKRSRAWPDRERRSAGAQGWNIDYLALDLVRCASTAPSGEWKAAGEGTVPDTLLGPEGSGESLTSGRYHGHGPSSRRTTEHARPASTLVRARPYVENYTVDASILKSLCIKFLRANGGCLGTRNRRRT
jgi:hypothetical protein